MKFARLKVVLILVTVFAISFNGFGLTPKSADDEIVIVMCGPLADQIENIEVMYEKDIITLDRIKLIAVYHEGEDTDYAPARRYVEENNLSWVTFQTIEGEVDQDDLFKKNDWTKQFREIFDNSDGITFTGGADFPPGIYGQENILLTDAATPVRSYYEVSFLFHLLGGSRNPGFKAFLESRPTYSVLGICLGFQTMNVACGGTLVQDIPSQKYKLKSTGILAWHLFVSPAYGGGLWMIFGEKLFNTFLTIARLPGHPWDGGKIGTVEARLNKINN